MTNVIQMRSEHLLHQMHERGRSIGQTERQHQELEVSIASAEGSLGHIGGVDAHLMVARAQIDLAEVLRTMQIDRTTHRCGAEDTCS